MSGKEMSTLFTAVGKITKREVSIKPHAYPIKVLAYVKERYNKKKLLLNLLRFVVLLTTKRK